MQELLSFPESRKAVNVAAMLEDEAQTYLASGDAEGEAEALAALLELEPDNVSALINLGTVEYNRGRHTEALSLYRRATEANPRHALAFFNLGNALDEMRQYPEAVEAYKQALAIDPRYEDAHYNLALAYSRTGEKRKAIPHWGKYVRLDPSSVWGGHARGELRRLLRVDPLQLVRCG